MIRDHEARQADVNANTDALEKQQKKAEREKEDDIERVRVKQVIKRDLYDTYTAQAAEKKEREEEYEADMQKTNFGPVYTLDMDKFSESRAKGIAAK